MSLGVKWLPQKKKAPNAPTASAARATPARAHAPLPEPPQAEVLPDAFSQQATTGARAAAQPPQAGPDPRPGKDPTMSGQHKE